jgi:TetR/AcrR family transcriptional regulator, mexJK operon transcriptional repressor
MSSNPSPASRQKAAPKLSGPGRPKDLAKRDAILEAAKRLFAGDGYTGVSMDQIAAEAGVSKLTVYSHFGDKEALFAAAVRAKCEEMLPDDLFAQELKGPLRAQLRAIASAFFALISSDEAISTHRMMITPGNADDPLRRLFWEAGPQRTHQAFGAFLQSRVEAGELDIDDVQRASEQFFALIKGELHGRMMCGLCARPARGDVNAHLDASVDMFLRAYAKP